MIELTENPDSNFRQAARQMGSKEQSSHGLASFFPEDGTVCRLLVTSSSDHSHLNRTTTIVSTVVTAFGPVEIDGHLYWFPSKTVIMTRTEQTELCLRSMMVATEYHKVDAQSTVTTRLPGLNKGCRKPDSPLPALRKHHITTTFCQCQPLQ